MTRRFLPRKTHPPAKKPIHANEHPFWRRQAHLLLSVTAKEFPELFGRTGSGKSSSSAIPNLLVDSSSPPVVIDIKGQLAEETRQVSGHAADIIVISPFSGLPDDTPNHAFNPLSVVDLNSSPHQHEAIHFAKELIRPNK